MATSSFTSTSSSHSRTLTPVQDQQDTAVGDSSAVGMIGISQDSAQQQGTDKDVEMNEKGEEPYSVFSKNTKWLIVVLASFAGVFSPISSNILVPALPQLVVEFRRSVEDINLTMTMFLIAQGLTPAFWGAYSDSFGRRPVYILTLSIYIAANIGLALTPTSAFWLLLLLRVVQAAGSAATIAIGSGCCADIATPQERGTFLGLFGSITMMGPALGPIFGGVLTNSLSWRWIFWFLAIWCGVVLIVLILFLPESLRSLVGNGSIPPPAFNTTPFALLASHKSRKAALEDGNVEEKKQQLTRKKFAPLASFRMLLYPDVILLLVFSSFIYSVFYCVLTTFSTLLLNNYGFSETIIGLCYLGNGGGSIISAMSTGKLLDWDFRREKKKLGFESADHNSLEGFPIEATRLRLMPYIVIIYLSAVVGYGWSMQTQTHVAVPIIMNFFIGYMMNSVMTITSVLLVDLFPGSGGAITASFNLVRCLLGAAAVSIIEPIQKVMGTGWAFVLLSGLCVLVFPFPVLLVRKGPQWRTNRAQAIQRHDVKHEKKRLEKEAKLGNEFSK